MPVHHITNYVEYLKQRPEHIRRRVALLASGGVTLVIAFGWLVGLLSSGALAINTTGTSEAARELASATSAQTDNFSDLMGAAAAFRSGMGGESLTVVESYASSTLDAPETVRPDATVIPF